MAESFFFYDLETSGFNPRSERIMQFAGQRTDMELQPIGDPINLLIKLTPEILPSPDAVLVTGITPQKTISEGLTEAEFLKIFYEEVAQPKTIFTGFNSVRFDDEFINFLNYRNFYDAYEWRWGKGNSRWDILDVVRMTRALRPDGIEWPFASDGKPANRLEMLTAVNKLEHSQAHDALSDVTATIAVAGLLRANQPKLFDYLLSMRDKKDVAKLVTSEEPFAYTSGRYPSEYLHTTIAVQLVDHPQAGSSLVYDLRHDPTPFIKMSVDELVEVWRFTKDPDALRLPVKTLKHNRCPAIAPVGVINDKATEKRIGLSRASAEANLKLLLEHQAEFADKVLKALSRLDTERDQAQAALVDNQQTVDERLYDGFVGDADKRQMISVRVAQPEQLAELGASFKDERLKSLLPLYKARNYPSSLSSEERTEWDKFCRIRLFEGGDSSRIAKYMARLEELSSSGLTGEQQYLLEELKLYAESIVPVDEAG